MNTVEALRAQMVAACKLAKCDPLYPKNRSETLLARCLVHYQNWPDPARPCAHALHKTTDNDIVRLGTRALQYYRVPRRIIEQAFATVKTEPMSLPCFLDWLDDLIAEYHDGGRDCAA